MAIAIRILFCWAFLFPAPLASQMPAPLGKLQITSTTPAGVVRKDSITINGVSRKEKTPVTLAVVPNTYNVVIGTCASQSVKVASGQTAPVSCVN
ncbi:MAG: hypothetical protein WAM91_08935 [Candidatus Acidiferrales bacterium]